MSSSYDDLQRLRREYARRDRDLTHPDRYSRSDPAHLFALQSRQRAALKLLRCRGFYPLDAYSLLDLGCGSGSVLLEYLAAGARPSRLHGLDLLPARLARARETLPHLPLTCADGQRLPYPDASFDLVLQYTVFTSILDGGIKRRIAREMRRVLRPGGLILWYDYWLNPTNPHARGIRPVEIRRLFPTCRVDLQRLTLAPPLARRLVPLSWTLAHLLEQLVLFNTHYLAAIQPPALDCA